ncbi:MAG: hypothetical protein DWQ04_23885 [Chloroflexi bacterium]|nr:MAG: hypothetical protein DWQ04_23885 [Chloroflexota bacterium]
MDDIRKTYEIRTTTIKQDELAQCIADHLAMHPLKAPQRWAEFAITAVSPTNANPDLADLHTALAQAAHAYDQIWVEIDITPSRWPLLDRIKKSLHHLVIFYVNRLGERQIKFNDRILRTVNLLAVAHSAKNEETAVLKQQITSLQHRLNELERQQS